MSTSVKLSEYPWFNTISDSLSQAYLNNRMPHALLIAAPEHSGKQEYAVALAQSLLCQSSKELQPYCGECKSCQLITAQSHPDYYWVDRLVDNKGKQKKSIGIDQIRALTNKLQDTAQLGGWRVAIIGSVSAMTTASFNSLLKTLEEPGANTLLILLADNAQNVPATIRSRCRLLVPNLSEKLVSEWLQKETNEPSTAVSQALKSCYGAPIAAKEFLSGQGAEEQANLFLQLDKVLKNQLTPSEFYQGTELDDSELANKLADYFYQVQLQQLQSNMDSPYQSLPAKLPYQLYAKVLDYRRAQQAGSNLQAKLQFEAILIQWFEIGKKIGHYSNT